MITPEQYLPKFSALTAEQRASLAHDVLEYQNETLAVVAQAEEPWSNETIAMYDKGLILVSTISKARDFCRVAYGYRQAFKRVNGLSSLLLQLADALVKSGDIEGESRPSIINRRRQYTIGGYFKAPVYTGKQGRPQKANGIPEVAAAGASDSLLRYSDSDPLRPTIAERPRHLSQYIDMLPEELRIEAGKIHDLYDQMDDIAHKLEQLCNNPESTQKDRAFHACMLCHTEDKLKNLWARIDLAYAEATGKTVSTDYKQFLASETLRINGAVKEKELCEMTKFDIDNMEEGPAKEAAKEARIDRDKKFLRKDDRKEGEQHKQNLMEAAKELHEWGVAITDSQVECCKKYGYDVPEDWIELPLEERKKLQQEARNAKRREERAIARAEREAKKQQEAEEAAAPYNAEGMSLFTED